VKAIVTGGAGGLGTAIVARLRDEGIEVEILDLTTGFDVTDETAWGAVGAVDVACLNAGVLGEQSDPARIATAGYRRAMGVNVDGVVFGIRRLAQVMPEGSRIVATASLAGLTGMPSDPVYAATKHAVVGFVRSVAPTLARRGISVNAVCPGIADTTMVADDARALFEQVGFPLLAPSEVADAVWLALTSRHTGHAWGVQPGMPPFDFRFPNLPGARTDDGVVVAPPPLTP
jgi:NAD(P)-dependent dehydrogenase (short-subunit alcohol dehydrogenase family)